MNKYNQAKYQKRRIYELIHPYAKHPMLQDAIDDIVHAIGFKEQREWEAKIAGMQLK